MRGKGKLLTLVDLKYSWAVAAWSVGYYEKTMRKLWENYEKMDWDIYLFWAFSDSSIVWEFRAPRPVAVVMETLLAALWEDWGIIELTGMAFYGYFEWMCVTVTLYIVFIVNLYGSV